MAYKTIQTQTLTVAKTNSIKRGFVKHFVDFIAKKGKATVAELQSEFTGRQFNSKKVTNERVVRYPYWCVSNGVLKVAAQAKASTRLPRINLPFSRPPCVRSRQRGLDRHHPLFGQPGYVACSGGIQDTFEDKVKFTGLSKFRELERIQQSSLRTRVGLPCCADYLTAGAPNSLINFSLDNLNC